MLTLEQIFIECAPLVANIVLKRGGVRVSSGSGFIAKNHLVTCAHVMDEINTCDVEILFDGAQETTPGEWKIAQEDIGTFNGYSAEDSYDYAVLAPPPGVTLGSSLKFSAELPAVGAPVCCLGYPFEDPHLTIHAGHVSAVFDSGPAKLLKLDMSVNPSNSGGPLICMTDGTVAGVVARRKTGLTEDFRKLQGAYDKNIEALSGTEVTMLVGGVDPINVLLEAQNQMKVLSREIERSANVGIGYAVWIDPLRQETALQ